MTNPSGSRLRGKVLVGDRLRSDERAVPVEIATAPPVVEWRRRGCRDRLLRVYLAPDGWHVFSDGFRVSPDEWLERMKADGHATTVGGTEVVFTNMRKIDGIITTLPLDETTWGEGSFEIGCEHRHEWVELADLATDCHTTRKTLKPVAREFPETTE